MLKCSNAYGTVCVVFSTSLKMSVSLIVSVSVCLPVG